MASWFRRFNARRNVDEAFVVLDASNSSSIEQFFRNLSKASVAKQVAIGGLSGWCSGFLFCKVGRPAALAVGTSLLVLQIATHRGYIRINWTKLNRTVEKTKKELEQKDPSRVLNSVRIFIEDNLFLAGGFAGGFLIGLATA